LICEFIVVAPYSLLGAEDVTEESVWKNAENRVLGSSVCFKILQKIFVENQHVFMDFVGECHVGLLLGEFMSVNRNITTKEMLIYGSAVKFKLSLCIAN
jgi:hypothetical protein